MEAGCQPGYCRGLKPLKVKPFGRDNLAFDFPFEVASAA
jgi:hypothetical protein